jgi:hypothetical protein
MYEKTVAEIERRMNEKFSKKIIPDINENEFSPAHLLGMLQEIKNMKDPIQAARWIGWASCDAVRTYQIITLEEIRGLVKEDEKGRK